MASLGLLSEPTAATTEEKWPLGNGLWVVVPGMTEDSKRVGKSGWQDRGGVDYGQQVVGEVSHHWPAGGSLC